MGELAPQKMGIRKYVSKSMKYNCDLLKGLTWVLKTFTFPYRVSCLLAMFFPGGMALCL